MKGGRSENRKQKCDPDSVHNEPLPDATTKPSGGRIIQPQGNGVEETKMPKNRKKKSKREPLGDQIMAAEERKQKELFYILSDPLVLVKPEIPPSTLATQQLLAPKIERRVIPQKARYKEAYQHLKKEEWERKPPRRKTSREERVERIVEESKVVHKMFAERIQRDREYIQTNMPEVNPLLVDMLENPLTKSLRSLDEGHRLLTKDNRVMAELAKINEQPRRQNAEQARRHADRNAETNVKIVPSTEIFGPGFDQESKLSELYPLDRLNLILQIRKNRAATLDCHFESLYSGY